MLCLYPRAYREQFGDEMRQVFDDVCAAMAQEGAVSRLSFYLSEFRGLLWGAASEHIRALGAPHGFEFFGKRSLYMQPERRFSWTAIVFMTLVLGVAILIIIKGQGVAYDMTSEIGAKGVLPLGSHRALSHSLSDWPTSWGLVGSIGIFFVLTWVVALIAWGIAHVTRRSGVHRLDDAQTWPQTR
jgi:hypothetical protein